MFSVNASVVNAVASRFTIYVLIYRTLLIIPDTFLGNHRCSNTTGHSSALILLNFRTML